MYERPRHGFVGTLFRLLLLVFAVYAAFLGVSGYRIWNLLNAVTQAYDSYETAMASSDYEAAYDDIYLAGVEISELHKEMEGWQWKVARKAPILNQDVICAQDSVAISDALMNDALIPVLSGAKELLAVKGGQELLSMVEEKAAQVTTFADALNHARDVTRDCEARISSVPVSHVRELNDFVANLTKTLDQTSDGFERIGLFLDAATAGEVVSSLS